MISHKGYLGRMEVDAEARRIHGRVVGLRDVITFEGETVEEAERAFRESVDDYLEFCRSRGERPERPHSGNFQVRLGPDLHRQLAMLAEAQSMSLNELMRRLAHQAVGRRWPPPPGPLLDGGGGRAAPPRLPPPARAPCSIAPPPSAGGGRDQASMRVNVTSIRW